MNDAVFDLWTAFGVYYDAEIGEHGIQCLLSFRALPSLLILRLWMGWWFVETQLLLSFSYIDASLVMITEI
jgi:hypothetical protein